MKEKKISVIIPVYNTEQYLKRCLNSILSQSYRNIELIIVNDSSPGDAEKIVNEFLEKDYTEKQIKYISHKTNKGLFQTRLSGAEAATGDYIAFVDSDDYISYDFYRLLMFNAMDEDADIVIGNTVHERKDGSKYVYNFHNSSLEFESLLGEQVKDAYFNQKGLCYSWHTIWNKIYKKSLWDKCYPYYKNMNKHIIMTEDIAFSTLLFYYANKVTKISNEAYFYCENDNASTNNNNITINKFKKNISDISNVFNFVEEFFVLVKADTIYINLFSEFRKLYSRMWRGLLEKFTGNELKQAINILNSFLVDYEEKCCSDDYFFSSITTDWNGGLEYNKEIISKNQYEYVSFDIFDTIITRPFYNPTDLFKLLNEKFEKIFPSNIDFYNIRIEGEKRAREKQYFINSSYQDIDIKDIYDTISNEFHIDKKITDDLMNEEKLLEIEFCKQRKASKEIYDLVNYLQKKIIFISDMYLDIETIKKILDKNGYKDYYRLFLSSDKKLTKHSGDLYKEVLRELKTKGNKIIHIGDTWHSDIDMAKASGINTVFMPKGIEVFENKIDKLVTNNCGNAFILLSNGYQDANKTLESLGFRSMLAIIANKYFDNPYRSFNTNSDYNIDPYFIGYYLLGMHMLGLSQWLNIEGYKRNKNKIYFMARDGYLPMLIYKEYKNYITQGPEAEYLQISRRAILPGMIKTTLDLFDLPIEYRNHSPKSLMELLEFCSKHTNEQNVINILKSKGILYYKTFNNRKEYNYFINIFIELFYDNYKHNNSLNIAKEYYKRINENDIAFDMGYSGRIQGALSYILGKGIDVLFIHSDNNRSFNNKRKLDFNIDSFYDYSPVMTGLIREHILSESSGSCIGFEIINFNVIPKFEFREKNYQDELITRLLHKGAIQFAKDFMGAFGCHLSHITFKGQEVSMPFESYLRFSNRNDRKIFSSSYFEDLVYGAKEQINIEEFINNELDRYPDYGHINAPYNPLIKPNYNNINSKLKRVILYWILDKDILRIKLWTKLRHHKIIFRTSRWLYRKFFRRNS
ncbi:HAD-IA family hydrolase [Clostridium sp. KNHs205]|uniref:HAD-IA family hydrolase n=1 Tax=Clostridium sp. KNHs205 TaxID=1449050 RepID=UPI00051BB57F|nr:HAD-IA family hydrolase [Clostridium sp. KNHs205]